MRVQTTAAPLTPTALAALPAPSADPRDVRGVELANRPLKATAVF